MEDEDKKPDERFIRFFYKLRICTSVTASAINTFAWIIILNPHRKPGMLSAMFGGICLYLAAKETGKTYNTIKEYQNFKKNMDNQY